MSKNPHRTGSPYFSLTFMLVRRIKMDEIFDWKCLVDS